MEKYITITVDDDDDEDDDDEADWSAYITRDRIERPIREWHMYF